MRVLMVAPPWIPVPPPAYGGTEAVIDSLTRALLRLGHEVVLFTTGDSTIDCPKQWHFAKSLGLPDVQLGPELAHVISSREFALNWHADVIHDHSLVGAVMSSSLPLVVTNHGPFDDVSNIIFERASRNAAVVAISKSQANFAAPTVRITDVIHHGIDIEDFPVGDGSGKYLAFVGRMNPDKGVREAIQIAWAAKVPLHIAAKMREKEEVHYFEREIRPLLGGDIQYLGELDGQSRNALLCGASALLNPINWDEPFGMVMLESLACGTPVITTTRGAAPEIVEDGITGLLADSFDELTKAVFAISDIDRNQCRRSASLGFSAERMAADYASLYASIAS